MQAVQGKRRPQRPRAHLRFLHAPPSFLPIFPLPLSLFRVLVHSLPPSRPPRPGDEGGTIEAEIGAGIRVRLIKMRGGSGQYHRCAIAKAMTSRGRNTKGLAVLDLRHDADGYGDGLGVRDDARGTGGDLGDPKLHQFFHVITETRM